MREIIEKAVSNIVSLFSFKKKEELRTGPDRKDATAIIQGSKTLTVSGACGIKDKRYKKIEDELRIILAIGRKAEVIKTISGRRDFSSLEKCLMCFLAGGSVERSQNLSEGHELFRNVKTMWKFLFATLAIMLFLQIVRMLV